MSLPKEFNDWINDALPQYPINFNTSRPDDVDPWFVMSVTSAETFNVTFCNTGGITEILITGFGSERYDTFETMETLRELIELNLKGALNNYNVFNVMTTGTISTGTVENQMNEYTCEIVISWDNLGV